MSVSGLFNWFSTEIKYVLFIALFVLLIVTAFKRAWIAMVGVLIGLAFIGIFIVNPNAILSLSQWLASKLSIR